MKNTYLEKHINLENDKKNSKNLNRNNTEFIFLFETLLRKFVCININFNLLLIKVFFSMTNFYHYPPRENP